MDRFFKKSSSEAAQAKEEVELLQQKIKTMGEVATALEAQLNDEKTKYTLLLTKTNTWKEKVKALTESDRSRIAELESQLAAYHVAGEASGGELTPEIRAAVQAALRGIVAKHAEEMGACKQQVAAAQATLSTKETTIAELMQELEAVKAVYLESQQRFAEEMQSVTNHHEKEMAHLRCQPESLQELEDLKSRFQEQQKEIASLENHSLQNAQIMSVLQQDLASSAEKNESLIQEVRSLQESLETLKQKQAIWKEKVMQMKAKDDETIKQLQSELALMRESSLEMNHSPPVAEPPAISQPGTSATAATLDRGSTSASKPTLSPPEEHLYKLSIQLEEEPINSRQFQEQLAIWKQKVNQMKVHDTRTIEALQAECDHLRHQLAAGADEQAQAHEALRAELAAAQSERDNAAQQAQRHAEELEQLRHQLAAGADEQAQAHEALRAELAAAQSERDNAAQQAQRHAEDAACVRQELGAKAAQLEQLEASLLSWKEKVKSAKLMDSERILRLSEERDGWQREAARVSEAVRMLCASAKICSNAGSPTEWSESLCEAVKDGQAALVCLSFELWTESTWAGIQGFKEQLTAYLGARASAAKEAAERVEALEAEVLRLKESEASLSARCENTEAHARSVEEDLKRASTQAERVSELEQETSDLRTRCNLLRKELQRQREAMQRDRSQPHETANSEAAASPITENASAVQSVLLAAAGCVSERDVVTFVDSRGSQGGSLKLSKLGAEQLIKENAELKRENAHNNTVIAQYIRELEGYKANERVQLSIEYLRNIVQQYLCAAEDLRPKMIPAICTVLEFSSKQKEDVQTANPRCPRFH